MTVYEFFDLSTLFLIYRVAQTTPPPPSQSLRTQGRQIKRSLAHGCWISLKLLFDLILGFVPHPHIIGFVVTLIRLKVKAWWKALYLWDALYIVVH